MKLFSRRWMLLTGLVLAGLWIAATRAEPGSTTAGRIPAPRQGFLAPDFSLNTLDSQNVRLSDLRGKAIIVNMWASWCPPCQAEMPAMQRVYQDYHGRGLEILAVNAAYSDDESAARGKAQGWGLTFPVLLDVDGAVNRLYEVQSLPTTFFIDSEGLVRRVVVGGPLPEALLRIEVEKLLELNVEARP